jgi:hypothetical protein
LEKKNFDLLYLEKIVFQNVTDILKMGIEKYKDNYDIFFNSLIIIDKILYYQEIA